MFIGALLEMVGIGAIPAFAALVGSPERVIHSLVCTNISFLHRVPQSRLLFYAARRCSCF